jgi:hypothetical protein
MSAEMSTFIVASCTRPTSVFARTLYHHSTPLVDP